MKLDRTLLYPILFRPDVVEERLDQIRRAGLVTDVPNAWQISLGVLRMWHRVVFRPESIGTSATHPVRPSLRARLPVRLPDAVHLAAARQSGCSLFVTNDAALRPLPEMEILHIETTLSRGT